MKKDQVKLFLILIGLALFGFVLGSQKEAIRTAITSPRWSFLAGAADTISAGELKKLLATKDFMLINVHTPYEGEIAKTDTFVPYDAIVENTNSLPKDKNAAIILYCKSGNMSGQAVETMKKLGYTNVRHLAGGMDSWKRSGGNLMDLSSLEQEVTPDAGIELPISWGDLGPRLVSAGVIDLAKFKEVVKLTPEQEKVLTDGSNDKIRITKDNSQFVVDILWAIGLAQKSDVYDNGPMGKEYKKDAGNFASTGGWTLARGNAMNYLNRFNLIKLTDEQQKKVSEIAQNVYRPCCGNSTWFPDCNHGMAALAAIEMMVAAGLDDKTIYKNVLTL
ncbi:hypothetical protein HYV22_02685, partial [Candidatus Gottesmanbacteria bacterium]|nr:hypothetical protein [Candidatus Gottesmanbacteria bacterium]